MKKGIIWLIILVAIVIIGIVVYKNDSPSDQKVKIGVIGPMTDIFAQFGEEALAGVKSVTDQYPNIELVVEDDKCEPAPAISAFRKLVDIDGVNFILGPGCGSPQEAIAPLIGERNVLNILVSAATRDLHGIGNGKIYNSQYSLQQESAFMAQKMYELGYQKVVLVSYNNAFSKTHTESFKENFRGEIVSDIIFGDYDSDVSTEITKLKGVEADAIFVTDGSFFFGQGVAKLEQYGVNLPVFSMYVVETPSVRSLAEGVAYSFPSDVGEMGASYEFSKIAAEILVEYINKCDGDYDCVVKEFEKSDKFNEHGIRNQDIILKQIVNGEPVVYE